MTGLLCRIGIHRPTWAPVTHATSTSWAPPVRRCQNCPTLLPAVVR